MMAIAIFWLVGFIVFLPLVLGVFGLHNDYTLFAQISQSSWQWLSHEHHLPLTQWLAYLLIQWQSQLTANLESLAWWRFLGLVTTLTAIALLLRVLRQQGISQGLTLLAGLWMLVLPAIGVGFLWAVHVIPGSVNMLIALIASGCIHLACRESWLPLRIKDWGLFALGIFLLIISLWIYYPTACVFLLVSFIRWLWGQTADPITLRIALWRDLGLFLLVITLFWLIDHWVMVRWMHASAAVNASSYWLSLTPKWMIIKQMILSSLAGVWQIYPGIVHVMLLMELATWLLLGFYAGFKHIDFWPKMGRALMVALIICFIVVLPLFFMPVTSGIRGMRVLVVGMLIALIIKIWMIDQLNPLASRRLRRVIAGFWVLLILGGSYIVINGLINWHKAELMAVEASLLKAHHQAGIRTIYIQPLPNKHRLEYQGIPYELSFFISDGIQVKSAFDILGVKHGINALEYEILVTEKDRPVDQHSMITRVVDFLK